MKIASLAVLAASILTLAVPTLAEAHMMMHHSSRSMMMRHHSSHPMMMRGHHMHMMGRGKMVGHRNF